MPKRFVLPTVTRRQTSTALVVLVLVLAVPGWACLIGGAIFLVTAEVA